MIEKLEGKFTKYEIARILGARSLQLSMDAPVLLKLTKEEEEEINYDTLKIAEKELEAGVLPITVRRPFPKKSEKAIKKLSEEEIREKLEEQAKKEKKMAQQSENENPEKEESESVPEIEGATEIAPTEEESFDEDIGKEE